MFTSCISTKRRQNEETLNLWLIELGGCLGESDNVCQAFLLVGVWFPGLVNIGSEEYTV